MLKSTTRAKRVADLIRDQLACILLKKISDPRLDDFSLTAVDISPDLRQAKIFYIVLNKDKLKDVRKALTRATGYLRCMLANTTRLRYVPQLRFFYDESVERGLHMSEIIDKVIDEDGDSGCH